MTFVPLKEKFDTLEDWNQSRVCKYEAGVTLQIMFSHKERYERV